MSRAKYNRTAIEHVITMFTRAAEKRHGSHAYAAGALSTMLAIAMEDMPLHKQKELVYTMSQLTHNEVEL